MLIIAANTLLFQCVVGEVEGEEALEIYSPEIAVVCLLEENRLLCDKQREAQQRPANSRQQERRAFHPPAW